MCQLIKKNHNSFGFIISQLLVKNNHSVFDISIEEQKRFLYNLHEPKDDYERSFNQYLCQCYFAKSGNTVVLNIVSAICYVPVLFILVLNRLRVKFVKQKEAVGEFRGLEEVIPTELSKRYIIDNNVWDRQKSLGRGDFKIIKKLVSKYPLYPYFTLKCILKIAFYSSLVKKYKPKAIVVHNEYSFTSSVLTEYCTQNCIRHINAMHGEKLFYIRDSFFRYHECYVWDEFYIQLFSKLRAGNNRFTIAIPPSLMINVNAHLNDSLFADYKYYLGKYTETELKGIVNAIRNAVPDTKVVKFRPHPRYSDISLLRKYVLKEEVENPFDVSITDSIANAGHVVGVYSTVLLQAYFSGISIILDDCSSPKSFSQLKELDYMLADKNIPVLSSFVKVCPKS